MSDKYVRVPREISEATADEGSGIGVPEGFALVSRTAPSAWLPVAKRLLGADADDALTIWAAMIAASPDIDRSGLVQEVEWYDDGRVCRGLS